MPYRIDSLHSKYPSCSYEGSDIEDITDDDGNVSWAAVAIARVIDERETMEDCACGGSIGGGSRRLVLVELDADGDEVEEYNLHAGNPDVDLPDGRVAPETVAELSAPCWDGNNHTQPDVTKIAALAGCDSAGHWDAGDWLNVMPDATETAADIVAEAAKVGVHLDEDEVETWLDERREVSSDA
jgi:hypothetical protein